MLDGEFVSRDIDAVTDIVWMLNEEEDAGT